MDTNFHSTSITIPNEGKNFHSIPPHFVYGGL